MSDQRETPNNPPDAQVPEAPREPPCLLVDAGGKPVMSDKRAEEVLPGWWKDVPEGRQIVIGEHVFSIAEKFLDALTLAYVGPIPAELAARAKKVQKSAARGFKPGRNAKKRRRR